MTRPDDVTTTQDENKFAPEELAKRKEIFFDTLRHGGQWQEMEEEDLKDPEVRAAARIDFVASMIDQESIDAGQSEKKGFHPEPMFYKESDGSILPPFRALIKSGVVSKEEIDSLFKEILDQELPNTSSSLGLSSKDVSVTLAGVKYPLLALNEWLSGGIRGVQISEDADGFEYGSLSHGDLTSPDVAILVKKNTLDMITAGDSEFWDGLTLDNLKTRNGWEGNCGVILSKTDLISESELKNAMRNVFTKVESTLDATEAAKIKEWLLEN